MWVIEDFSQNLNINIFFSVKPQTAFQLVIFTALVRQVCLQHVKSITRSRQQFSIDRKFLLRWSSCDWISKYIIGSSAIPPRGLLQPFESHSERSKARKLLDLPHGKRTVSSAGPNQLFLWMVIELHSWDKVVPELMTYLLSFSSDTFHNQVSMRNFTQGPVSENNQENGISLHHGSSITFKGMFPSNGNTDLGLYMVPRYSAAILQKGHCRFL